MHWPHVERQRAGNRREVSVGEFAVAQVKEAPSRVGAAIALIVESTSAPELAEELYRLIGGSAALQLISRSK
jgi:hypothetical protein